MTTTTPTKRGKAQQPAAPTTNPEIEAAFKAVASWSDGIDSLRQRSITQELEYLVPASEALMPWFTREAAIWAASHTTKLTAKDFRSIVARDFHTAGHKLVDRADDAWFRTMIDVVPLHSDDTFQEFMTLTTVRAAEIVTARAAKATAKDTMVPSPIVRDIATYLRLLPALAKGHYDNGHLTEAGAKAESEATAKRDEGRVKRAKTLGTRPSVSGTDVPKLVADMATASNTDPLIVARRIVADAITAMKALEGAATAEQRKAAEAAVKLAL